MLLMSSNSPQGEGLEDAIDRTIGENVRVRREALKKTQREFAQELTSLGWRVDNTAVARIESGRRSLRVGQLALLARALGVGVETLFEPSGLAAATQGLRDAIARTRAEAVRMIAAMENYDAARDVLKYEIRRLEEHLGDSPRDDSTRADLELAHNLAGIEARVLLHQHEEDIHGVDHEEA